jgi:cytochrome c551/c552
VAGTLYAQEDSVTATDEPDQGPEPGTDAPSPGPGSPASPSEGVVENPEPAGAEVPTGQVPDELRLRAPGSESLPESATDDSPPPGTGSPASQSDPAPDEAFAPPASLPPGYPYVQPATQPELHEPQPFPVPEAGPARRRRGRLPLVLGMIAGVLAVAVIAVLVFRGATRTPPPETGPTAADAVQAYLEALARGDATAALAWADTPPSEAGLLTDEVLATSLARAPLTAIQVDASTGGASYEQVAARYRIGGQPVSANFDVVRSGGQWKLDEVSAPARLALLDTGEAGLELNGTVVAATEVQLFPGSYALTTTDPRFRIAAGTFVVEGPGRSPDLYSAELALSSQGRTAIESASRRHLNDCVDRRQLMPKGCGFGAKAAEGVTFAPSGISWRVVSGREQLGDLDLTLDTPTSAWAEVRIRIAGDLTSTDGRRWKATSRIQLVKADLSAGEVAIGFS